MKDYGKKTKVLKTGLKEDIPINIIMSPVEKGDTNFMNMAKALNMTYINCPCPTVGGRGN